MTSQLPASYPANPPTVNLKHRPRLRELAKIRFSHPTTYQVWMMRSGHNNRLGDSIARQETIASELGISVRSVERAEAALIASGIVNTRVEMRNGRPCRVVHTNIDFGDDRTWPCPKTDQSAPTPIFKPYRDDLADAPDRAVGRPTELSKSPDRAVGLSPTELSHEGTPLKEPHGGGEERAVAAPENPPPTPSSPDGAAPDPDAARLMESWKASRESIGGIGRPDPDAAQRILDQLPPEPERRRSALERVERAMLFLARHPYHGPRVVTLDKLASRLEELVGEACAKDAVVRDGPKLVADAEASRRRAERKAAVEDLATRAVDAVWKRTKDLLAAKAIELQVLTAGSLEAAQAIAEAAIRG